MTRQSAMLCLVSGAVLAGSTDIAVFLVFRFFAGAGAFMILAAVPIWMSEVVPPYLRGALVQLHAVSLVVGYMLASWIGYGIFFWKDDNNWRLPFAIQCFPPLCLLLGLYWVPESRQYLLFPPLTFHVLTECYSPLASFERSCGRSKEDPPTASRRPERFTSYLRPH